MSLLDDIMLLLEGELAVQAGSVLAYFAESSHI